MLWHLEKMFLWRVCCNRSDCGSLQLLQEAVRAPFQEDLQAVSVLWHYSKGEWDRWAEVKSYEITKALSTI